MATEIKTDCNKVKGFFLFCLFKKEKKRKGKHCTQLIKMITIKPGRPCKKRNIKKNIIEKCPYIYCLASVKNGTKKS